MYKSKHPKTWDESIPYVQKSYNIDHHISTGHSPFQVDLGFNPLCLIDDAMAHAITQTKSTHVFSKVDKASRFIEHIQHIH